MAALFAVMMPGFPMGLFVPGLVSDLMFYLNLEWFNTSVVGYLVLWLIAAMAGYFQWFILLPRGAKFIWKIVSKLGQINQ